MQRLVKILFLLLIIGCGSDAGSKIISSSGVVDPNTGNGGNGGRGGDGGNGGTLTIHYDDIKNLKRVYNNKTVSSSTKLH